MSLRPDGCASAGAALACAARPETATAPETVPGHTPSVWGAEHLGDGHPERAEVGGGVGTAPESGECVGSAVSGVDVWERTEASGDVSCWRHIFSRVYTDYSLTLSVPLLGIPNKRILTLFAPLKCWMSYLGLKPLGRGTALMLFVISFSSVNHQIARLDPL